MTRWILLLVVVAASVVILPDEAAVGQGLARLDLVAQTTFVGEDPAVVDISVREPRREPSSG